MPSGDWTISPSPAGVDHSHGQEHEYGVQDKEGRDEAGRTVDQQVHKLNQPQQRLQVKQPCKTNAKDPFCPFHLFLANETNNGQSDDYKGYE
jgi:hypothetical protein